VAADRDGEDTDTLVVVSKVKKLVRDRSGFNMSQCCIDALTRRVVTLCMDAIEEAKRADRKTVMGRDIKR
jgi:histone H3/H4